MLFSNSLAQRWEINCFKCTQLMNAEGAETREKIYVPLSFERMASNMKYPIMHGLLREKSTFIEEICPENVPFSLVAETT